MSDLDSSAPNGSANACLKSPLEHSSYAVAHVAIAHATHSTLPVTPVSNPNQRRLALLILPTDMGLRGL